MKYKSWEIILAGILFVGLSIYIISRSGSDNKQKERSRSASVKAEDLSSLESIERKLVIDLRELEALSADSSLKELEELEKLQQLEKLEKIRKITSFLPGEVKDEIQMNIDLTLEEIGSEHSSIQVELRDGKLILRPKADSSSAFWSMESPGIYSHTDTFEAAGLGFTDIDLSFGSVEVVGSERSTARITITASGDFDNAADLESMIRTRLESREKKLSYTLQSISENNERPNIQILSVIEVPQRMDIRTNTGAGHIEIDNVAGDHQLKTGGGHIRLNRITGLTQAETSGGNIRAAGIKGKAQLLSRGGHLSLSDSDAEAEIKTNGGNIMVSNVSGPVKASTNGGNINIELNSITAPVTGSTSAGNIELLLNPAASFDLSLSGRSFDFAAPFKTDGTSGGSYSGMINGGGPLIKASTGYGTISIKENE